MATFEGTDYSNLSEALRTISLPVWPMSSTLPPDVALSHLHSTPDMESPEVEIADNNTEHWRYAIAHPFLSQGILYRPHKDNGLAKRRFARTELDKILEEAKNKRLVLMGKCAKDPQYFHTQWQEYRRSQRVSKKERYANSRQALTINDAMVPPGLEDFSSLSIRSKVTQSTRRRVKKQAYDASVSSRAVESTPSASHRILKPSRPYGSPESSSSALPEPEGADGFEVQSLSPIVSRPQYQISRSKASVTPYRQGRFGQVADSSCKTSVPALPSKIIPASGVLSVRPKDNGSKAATEPKPKPKPTRKGSLAASLKSMASSVSRAFAPSRKNSAILASSSRQGSSHTSPKPTMLVQD